MPSSTTSGAGSRRPPRGATADPRDTPAMRQFARFKAEHPECVLFFRMGDFYEMFDDDAVLVHRVLGLTLTERTTGVPMAGVPHHQLETYLRRMIELGHRVAVCDQVQDPREAKGVVDRAVTRVLTPGTLVDESLLDEARPNQLAALHLPETPGGGAVIAAAELSTGEFTLLEVPADRIVDEIARLAPSELLFAESDDGSVPAVARRAHEVAGAALTPRPAWTFRPADARELLLGHYGVQRLDGFGLEADDPAICPAGALLRYLHETQAPGEGPGPNERGGRTGPLRHIGPPKRRSPAEHLVIDAASLQSLEIERTMRRGRVEGSLLSIMQKCVTAMGKRLLRQWLCFPLCAREPIEARLGAVSHLVSDRDCAGRLRERLGNVQDVARIVGRVCLGRATPRDLVGLGRSLAAVPELVEDLAGRPPFDDLCRRLAEQAEALAHLADAIRIQVVDHPPAHLREGGVFREGFDEALDEVRALQRDANAWLARYQKRLVEETAIPSLKVGYNKVFGYYIEITHAHAGKVPDTFSRKQTLKNAERYVTPELKEFEDKVTKAEARAIEREKTLFEAMCADAVALRDELSALAGLVAEVDVLGCFAEVAVRYGYVRPELDDEPVLEIVQGRHPVLDRTLGDRFVPNDCRLGASGSPVRTQLITGPNMAGKSTSIRQVALITLLAHTGSFVPAASARIGLADRIFTRIGAADELHAGQSTFMVEMTETANILHHATERSLVILDEIGRGTSTLDGLSLAWAIAETLAGRRCRTLFATHYHELTSLAESLETVGNLHVSVREWGDEIIFLYRILPGSTDRSYGIHVARIAGVPAATLDRANELLETLAVQVGPAPGAAAARPAQLSLFDAQPHPAVEALKAVDLDHLTPMAAFDVLRELVKKARG